MIHSFSQSNKKYFEEMADDLEGDSELGEPEEFVDSDDESDNQQPEFYQDSEDEEIVLNPVQAQPTIKLSNKMKMTDSAISVS